MHFANILREISQTPKLKSIRFFSFVLCTNKDQNKRSVKGNRKVDLCKWEGHQETQAGERGWKNISDVSLPTTHRNAVLIQSQGAEAQISPDGTKLEVEGCLPDMIRCSTSFRGIWDC